MDEIISTPYIHWREDWGNLEWSTYEHWRENWGVSSGLNSNQYEQPLAQTYIYTKTAVDSIDSQQWFFWIIKLLLAIGTIVIHFKH